MRKWLTIVGRFRVPGHRQHSMFSPLSIKQEIGFVPQNRLRFGERAFAVDRLEGFVDSYSEIRHVTLSASDIDDRSVWAALVKVLMRLRSSGKGYRKSLSSSLVALELEDCVWGIAAVSTWRRRWRGSCHGLASSSTTKSQTITSTLVATWDHRIIRLAAITNEN